MSQRPRGANLEKCSEGWMDDKITQKIVMGEKFVKNFVMDAKIDPKVVMDLSTFKIGGWNRLQPINQKLLEEFVDENEPWLLIGIPSRDPVLVTQYLERHSVTSDQHFVKEKDVTSSRSSCDDAMLAS